MAELIRCDRCHRTTEGCIHPDTKERRTNYAQGGHYDIHLRGGPSVGGWKFVELVSDMKRLLCPECIAKLKQWLCGYDEKQKRAN